MERQTRQSSAVGRAARLLAALAVHRPVVGEVRGREQRARDHAPALAAGDLHGARIRRRRRDGDRRPRLLVGLRQPAEIQCRVDRVLDAGGPIGAAEIIGRVARPDALDHLDRFDQHPAALARRRRNVHHLDVGRRRAGADAENEAALAQVIELRRLGGDHRRMMQRRVDDAGAEDQPLGARQQARGEHQRRRIGLGRGRVMLADEQLVDSRASPAARPSRYPRRDRRASAGPRDAAAS